MMVSVKFLLCSITVLSNLLPSEANADIGYKVTSVDRLIWTDIETGSISNDTIWHPVITDPGYCSLGNIAVDRYYYPTTKIILVNATKEGALVHPTNFFKVWNDTNVAVYVMDAPAGYTCIGGVAMNSISDQPHKNHYCCIKNQYTDYNDHGRQIESRCKWYWCPDPPPCNFSCKKCGCPWCWWCHR